MTLLILGLILFLGMHCVRVFADDWRTRMIERLGPMPWKAIYALISLLGFVLVIWGFGQARLHPTLLYAPPAMLRHLNSLFTLIAFVFFAAAYVPRNHFKAKLGHPMILGVKIWAFGHLLAIGFLRDAVLFGAFLAWAIIAYAAARRRDRKAGTTYPAGTVKGDIIAVITGVIVWAAFAFWLHMPLIGVNPMG
ncbi:NnrU family protein [Oleiagrimonas soli]|uniref:NnrU family protein n=1 Tax=Oleiagrimonas soli TaxID=1543381 RepID=A0A099CZ95_9GAMM|nr:NnrU family protein [Oleiagrimonas soli]KGI78981.1 NnrU family protein [Oleiagrimonas soli]MBB6184496.1 putative membrane protein [Oleiagrimonas soli]